MTLIHFLFLRLRTQNVVRKMSKMSHFRKCFDKQYGKLAQALLKLSLLRTGYFSSPANALTSTPNISHVNKRDFFEHN